MHEERSAEIHEAIRLMRIGRFTDAVGALERIALERRRNREPDPFSLSLLADALQRTGFNTRAYSIVSELLRRSSLPEPVRARSYFVLANVDRECGDTTRAIEHFQMAAANETDVELCCWVQLLLMATVAEVSGPQGAMGRLHELRRALARSGDPRPFAAFHLWLAQMETTRGYLSNARRDLRRAESLLTQTDDVWLHGQLAIYTSVVNYYCAEIEEAKRSAEIAIACAKQSGHRGTRRAANASLGHIEFSRGNLEKAEEHFRVALDCCEPGSVGQIGVLDSIAQVTLERGDLYGCARILREVDELASLKKDSWSRYYRDWATQTKIRLLLKQNKADEARKVAIRGQPSRDHLPQARLSAASCLLSAETLIANGELTNAARMLAQVLLPSVQVPPDLFAELEQVTAKAIQSSNASSLVRVHLERARRTYVAIGHSRGHSTAARELAKLPDDSLPALSCAVTVDRIRALMDTRARPELFGHEAVSLLEELHCTQSVTLTAREGDAAPVVLRSVGVSNPSATTLTVELNRDTRRQFELALTPREDPASIITTLEFHRLIEQILASQPPESVFGDLDVLWTAHDWSSPDGVVFTAESMLAILKTISKIAPTDISVLIRGETGSGKEIVARRIHEQSTRVGRPFVAVNCAAIPKELLESQLFGYRRGAFSGAAESFQGVVRAANGGTLLLDEIGEIPLETQAKLLRFLELGEVHPIGEAYPVKVNVRMLFSTNENLEKAVNEHRFREDLFYRLNVIPIVVPPLRERREEIPVLVGMFAQRFAREFSKDPAKFSTAAMELLILYSWPGNVRQLANEVRRIAALVESGANVAPELLSPEIRRVTMRPCSSFTSPQITIHLDQTLEQATANLEKQFLEHALRVTGGHVSDAARTLGLSRKGLYLKRKRLGLFGLHAQPPA